MLDVLQQTGLGHFLMTLISFILLLAIVHRFAWKPINGILEERESRIKDDINQANASKEQALTLQEEAEADRKKAKQDATAIMQETNKKIEREKMLAVEAAELEIAQKRRREEEAIEHDRREMTLAMQDQVAQLSLDIAGQILQREVKAEDHEQLIEDLVLELDADQDEE